MADMLNRCGERDGKFYDRRGDYFRPGVDPRNYYGKNVPSNFTEWMHAYDCPAGFSDSPCDCGEPN